MDQQLNGTVAVRLSRLKYFASCNQGCTRVQMDTTTLHVLDSDPYSET